MKKQIQLYSWYIYIIIAPEAKQIIVYLAKGTDIYIPDFVAVTNLLKVMTHLHCLTLVGDDNKKMMTITQCI